MTRRNWIEVKIRPHVYEGEIVQKEAKFRYSITDPGRTPYEISSNKSLEDIQAKYLKSKVVKL